MRLSARTIAAMLIGLAFAAAQPEANSQSRGNSRSSSVSRSTSSSRPVQSASKSSDTKTKSEARPASKPSGNVSSRPSGSSSSSSRPKADISPADRKPSANKPSVQKPSGRPADKPAAKPADRPASKPSAKPSQPSAKPAGRPSGQPSVSRPVQNKPSGNRPSVNRPAPDRPSANKPSSNRPKPGPAPGFKPGHAYRPIGVRPPSRPSRPPRVHPRDRDFMDYNRVTIHWKNDPHYYGYRIQTLPSRAIKRLIGGITYYLLDDIWYRPYNGYYIVSRPPFGTSLAANIISDIAWTAVTLSYYNTVANTYDTISENNAYIAQQNAVIAQNNATIAAQNQAIAQSQSKAQAAYGLANELGLVQSYGSASDSYFYQDGVFYSQGSDGQYYVIVPPAGAVVDRLPEDFDTVILNGNKYYRVDDTIYQMVINEGKPYFEVLGQMN